MDRGPSAKQPQLLAANPSTAAGALRRQWPHNPGRMWTRCSPISENGGMMLQMTQAGLARDGWDAGHGRWFSLGLRAWVGGHALGHGRNCRSRRGLPWRRGPWGAAGKFPPKPHRPAKRPRKRQGIRPRLKPICPWSAERLAAVPAAPDWRSDSKKSLYLAEKRPGSLTYKKKKTFKS